MGRGKAPAPSALSLAVSGVVNDSMAALGKSTSGFARDSGIGRSRLIDLVNGQAAWTITEVELAGRVFGHTVASLIEAADPDGALQRAGLEQAPQQSADVLVLPVRHSGDDDEVLLHAAMDMTREPGTTIEED